MGRGEKPKFLRGYVSIVRVTVRISCEFESLQGILRKSFFPLVVPLYPPKTETKNFCGARSWGVLSNDLWGVCSQLDRGKPEHLAGNSHPGLPKCQGPECSFARWRCWASGPCSVGYASSQDVLGLTLLHRRSLQKFPYLGQSAASKIFCLF